MTTGAIKDDYWRSRCLDAEERIIELEDEVARLKELLSMKVRALPQKGVQND